MSSTLYRLPRATLVTTPINAGQTRTSTERACASRAMLPCFAEALILRRNISAIGDTQHELHEWHELGTN